MMRLSSLCLLLILSVLTSCSSPTAGGAEPPAKITKVAWYSENIDPSFWSTALSPSSQRLYYSFFIDYSGSLKASDIESARVYLPGNESWWTIDPNIYLDDTRKFIGGGRRRTTEGTYLPVGVLKAVLSFKNGTSTSLTFETGIPGSFSAGTKSYLVSENNAVSLSGSSEAALVRPSNVALSKSADSVTVNFTLSDNRIFNGWIWFYSSDSTYIGQWYAFKDLTTGTVPAYVNGGSGSLNTTGSNTVVIPKSALTPASAATSTDQMWTDLAQCVVVVSDGTQYTGRFDSYDFLAVSARVGP